MAFSFVNGLTSFHGTYLLFFLVSVIYIQFSEMAEGFCFVFNVYIIYIYIYIYINHSGFTVNGHYVWPNIRLYLFYLKQGLIVMPGLFKLKPHIKDLLKLVNRPFKLIQKIKIIHWISLNSDWYSTSPNLKSNQIAIIPVSIPD